MKVIAMALFATALVGLLFVWAIAPHSSAAQTGDYDTDDDGLIEIRALEQLNAIRWDLDGNGETDDQANRDAYAAAFPSAESGMGCPNSGCIGYELARDLDFDDPDSYASGAINAKWTGGAGWLPIGSSSSNSFSAAFDGNDYTIANLYIKRSGITDPGETGLFGENGYGSINRIGLTDVDVTGGNDAGALVGENFGVISASYAAGNVSGNRGVGGLVGWNATTMRHSYFTGTVSGDYRVGGLVGFNSGEISKSYVTGNVSGNQSIGGLAGESYSNTSAITASYTICNVSGGPSVGGLIGTNSGYINASYSMGSVVGRHRVDDSIIYPGSAGGLVGSEWNSGTISASYATGIVSGDGYLGGLIGKKQNNTPILASYWDTQTTGQSSGVGEGPSEGMIGKTTEELQSLTEYTGIYTGWLLDFDNADGDFDYTTGVDDFWDFGTSSEYPALKADFDGDGVATWQEFGDQRGQSPTPPPTSTTTPAVPTPVPQADLELTMLVTNYFGIPFYYMNNGPSDATWVVLTDNLPKGVSSMLSIPIAGTCSGETTVVCELGVLAVGSKNLVMIIARVDNSLSQGVPVNTASVSSAERDPYPANNSASR